MLPLCLKIGKILQRLTAKHGYPKRPALDLGMAKGVFQVSTWCIIACSEEGGTGGSRDIGEPLCAPFLYLKNYGDDLADILCVGKGYPIRPAKHVRSEVTLHVRTCAPIFHISETNGPIKLRFGVRVIVTSQGVPSISNVGSQCTCARANR